MRVCLLIYPPVRWSIGPLMYCCSAGRDKPTNKLFCVYKHVLKMPHLFSVGRLPSWSINTQPRHLHIPLLSAGWRISLNFHAIDSFICRICFYLIGGIHWYLFALTQWYLFLTDDGLVISGSSSYAILLPFFLNFHQKAIFRNRSENGGIR